MKFPKLFLALLIIFVGVCIYTHRGHSEVCPPIDVCFSPKGQCDQKIYYYLDQIYAHHSSMDVRVNSYVLTNEGISNRLDAIAQHNGYVRVLYDKSCNEGFLAKSCKIKDMPNVRAKELNVPGGIDHNKVIILGNYLVITGSANFTAQAYKRNLENVVFIWDRNIIQQYINEFDKTWEAN